MPTTLENLFGDASCNEKDKMGCLLKLYILENVALL